MWQLAKCFHRVEPICSVYYLWYSILLQVTVPLGFYEKFPVSVSFIARQGSDRFLLDTVQSMYASLQEQIDLAMKSNISSSSLSKEESAEVAKEKVGLFLLLKEFYLNFLCSILFENNIYFLKIMILCLSEEIGCVFWLSIRFFRLLIILIWIICGSDLFSRISN